MIKQFHLKHPVVRHGRELNVRVHNVKKGLEALRGLVRRHGFAHSLPRLIQQIEFKRLVSQVERQPIRCQSRFTFARNKGLSNAPPVVGEPCDLRKIPVPLVHHMQNQDSDAVWIDMQFQSRRPQAPRRFAELDLKAAVRRNGTPQDAAYPGCALRFWGKRRDPLHKLQPFGLLVNLLYFPQL